MTLPQFPPTSPHMQKATVPQLIRQGIWLHYASLAGPLRTSPRFRKENPNWVPLVMARWWKEYGLNMLVFLSLQPLIFMYAPHTLTAIAAWELAAVTLLPCLTVLQMLIDSIKPDVRVYCDPTSRTGLTVRHFQGADKQPTWAYYNHYALPVGHRHGVNIRKSLHLAAQANKTRLVCHAQSELVANHYEQETHPATPLRFEQQKPFLMWDYSPNQLNNYDDILPTKKKTSWRTLIGIDNIRNSGSAPLLFA